MAPLRWSLQMMTPCLLSPRGIGQRYHVPIWLHTVRVCVMRARLRQPAGWSNHSRYLIHRSGGATNGQFTVSLLVRSADFSGQESLPILQQRPWSTISHSLNCREYTPSVAACPSSQSGPTQQVVELSDGSVGCWGLLPVPLLPSQLVTMESHMSRSGWGRRRLTPAEISDLWNTPISVQDAFQRAGHSSSLTHFAHLPPAKVLAAGADVLCSVCIRGGVYVLGCFFSST